MLPKSTSRSVAYAISPAIFFESNSIDTYTHARKSKLPWSFDSHIIIGHHQFLIISCSSKLVSSFRWNFFFSILFNLSLILSTGEPCSHEIGMDWRWTRCWLPKEPIQPLFLTRRNSLPWHPLWSIPQFPLFTDYLLPEVLGIFVYS